VEILDLRLSRFRIVRNHNFQLAVDLLPRHSAHITVVFPPRVHVINPRHGGTKDNS